MKIVSEGYQYALENFEDRATQIITFIKKEPKPDNPLELETIFFDGTTNEEVLWMMVDRLEYLNKKMEDVHNVNAIHFLKQALDELNQRTADRLERVVEGKNVK